MNLLLQSFRKYLHEPPMKSLSSPFHLPCSYSNSPTSKCHFFPMVVGLVNINGNPSATTITKKSSRKVKLCCKFGGKLMPRLSDGTLHYAGGRTRIMDFPRDISLKEFYCKMENIYGGSVVICYKLSDQDLHTLVSVSSDEDLDNMMEKGDCRLEASEYESVELQVFLFPPYDRESSLVKFDDSESSHIVEVTSDANAQKDNMEGATSTLHLDVEGDGLIDQGHLNIIGETNLPPQIVNPPYDGPYTLHTYDEPHQDNKVDQAETVHFGVINDIKQLQIIKNCDIRVFRELGSGTFGAVYQGKWKGADVAIKMIHDIYFAGKSWIRERTRVNFWNEIFMLANLHHPNIITFYGIVRDGHEGSFAAITEYMIDGSLRSALLNYNRFLDRRKRILIAIDVAFGMEYLHDQNIIHFDLKSDNLLVNLRDPNRPICKISDFGLSKVKCSSLLSSGSARGTIPWMAPELLNGRTDLISEKVDVFSFGIVMWELLMGQEPYANIPDESIIDGIVSNTLRPSVPESCDPEWRRLMEQCWSTEPSKRPCFTEIANKLCSMTPPY